MPTDDPQSPTEKKPLVNEDAKAVLWWTVFKYCNESVSDCDCDQAASAADSAVDKCYPSD